MSKIISVGDDVYKELTELKGSESYSRLIRKLLEKKSNKEKILKFAGSECVDEKKIKELKKGWKKWSGKFV